MGNLLDEYPALLILPEVLLAVVILAAILVMRHKPKRVRRVRHVRPMPSHTVDDGRDPSRDTDDDDSDWGRRR